MQKEQLELIVGETLAKSLLKDDASFLIENIKKLRKEAKHQIPPIHITDEIEIDKNSCEIKKSNKLLSKITITQDLQNENLIEKIIENINEICKTN